MSADGSNWLRVRDLTKTYRSPGGGAVEAVRGVGFEVAPGSAVAVVGPNGAGKTSLLKVIAGVVVPSEGTVVRPARCAALLELGSAFHPDLTARENLELGLRLAGLTRREIRRVASDVVEFSGVGFALDRPIRGFSAGMRARLATSIALHGEPDLLLIDEVLAVGDRAFQAAVLSRAQEMVGRGASLLLVTHSPQLALAATRRGLLLMNGRLVFDGSIRDALLEYERRSDGWLAGGEAPGIAIVDVELRPPAVVPNEAVSVRVQLEVSRPEDGRSLRVELRPTKGRDAVWMRDPEEPPERRHLNLLASTSPLDLPELGLGSHLVEIGVRGIRVTPTVLELSVVVAGPDGTVLDHAERTLRVSGPQGRPRYHLTAQVPDGDGA